MSRRTIRVGKIKIVVPDKAVVRRALNLDEFEEIRASMRPDAYLRIELGDSTVSVLVEDTGRPEPRDLWKLDTGLEYIDRIGLRGNIREDLVVKILHHRGLGRGKTLIRRLARNLRVELQRCSSSIDLEALLRNRGII